MERAAPIDIKFTVDRINAILKAEGMPRCQDFTRPIVGISREAQACGALERKYRMPGLDLEHIRFWMKRGQRVKMLLGERVDALENHALLNPRYHPRPVKHFHIGDGETVEMRQIGGD